MLTKLSLIGGLLAALTACTTVSVPTSDIPASIVHAVTAADYQRLADYFSQKAVNYDAEAVQHERMARSYSGGQKGASSMASHCRALQLKLTEAAAESRALAQENRQMAANAPK